MIVGKQTNTLSSKQHSKMLANIFGCCLWFIVNVNFANANAKFMLHFNIIFINLFLVGNIYTW